MRSFLKQIKEKNKYMYTLAKQDIYNLHDLILYMMSITYIYRAIFL